MFHVEQFALRRKQSVPRGAICGAASTLGSVKGVCWKWRAVRALRLRGICPICAFGKYDIFVDITTDIFHIPLWSNGASEERLKCHRTSKMKHVLKIS